MSSQFVFEGFGLSRAWLSRIDIDMYPSGKTAGYKQNERHLHGCAAIMINSLDHILVRKACISGSLQQCLDAQSRSPTCAAPLGLDPGLWLLCLLTSRARTDASLRSLWSVRPTRYHTIASFMSNVGQVVAASCALCLPLPTLLRAALYFRASPGVMLNRSPSKRMPLWRSLAVIGFTEEKVDQSTAEAFASIEAVTRQQPWCFPLRTDMGQLHRTSHGCSNRESQLQHHAHIKLRLVALLFSACALDKSACSQLPSAVLWTQDQNRRQIHQRIFPFK